MGDDPLLSIVVPVFNEAGTIGELFQRLRAAAPPDTEIILVDDGSTDGGSAAMERIAQAAATVSLVRFTRNFGKTAALAAGFAVARGTWVAVLDADLQNDPEDLPALLSKAQEGFDAVVGWRKTRKDPFLTKRLPSRVANRLISSVTGLRIHDCGCGLGVFRRKLLEGLPFHGEMHRLLPAYLHLIGARVTEVEVRHVPRRHGRSHFGLERVYHVLVDLLVAKILFSYLPKPMRVFGGVGLAALVLSLLAAAFGIGRGALRGEADAAGLLPASLFLAGISVLAFLMGVLAEIVVRAAVGSRAVRIYFIEKTINC